MNNKENQDSLTNFVRTKKNQAVKLGFLYSLLIEKLKKPDPRRKFRSAAPEMKKGVEGRGKGVKK